tara:strand:+ start:770 stop:1270 length:501 start_codon:yes stop_codon:yes gene_type:complete
MAYNIRSIIILILLIDFGVFSHPFHATITSFDCKEDNKNIQVTIKIFTNDLEFALRQESKDDLIIDSENNLHIIDSLIFMYIKQNLVVNIDGNRKQFSWVGKEIENDVTWCYLEILNIYNFSKFSIENKLFLSVFDDQLNICHLYCADKPQTIMLHKEAPFGDIKY